jgi:hypothetical protein
MKGTDRVRQQTEFFKERKRASKKNVRKKYVESIRHREKKQVFLFIPFFLFTLKANNIV